MILRVIKILPVLKEPQWLEASLKTYLQKLTEIYLQKSSRKHLMKLLLNISFIFFSLTLNAQDVDFTSTLQQAEQGDADAQYMLALLYDNGVGVQRDLAEAARWY